ncbi:MAG: MarR family transcriptional regulator, partial [Candidatus Thorarchaeota archaeon]
NLDKLTIFRMGRYSKMMNEQQLQEELKNMKLTKSQMIVLDILRSSGKGGVTPKQLLDKVSFAPRTVRYALRKLLKKQLIKRIPCLQDMRQWIYIPA